MSKKAFIDQQIANTQERLQELSVLKAELLKEEEGVIRSARDKIVEILDSHNLTLGVYLTARQSPETASKPVGAKEPAEENLVIYLTKNGRERNTFNSEHRERR